jgi:hypothetical protein
MKGTAGAIALILALATGAPAMAGEARASFTVSAVVPARVTLTALDQPAELEVSAADVERGYAQIAATYRVSHNDRRGYLLSLLPRHGLTREIEVQGLATALVMGDDPVELVQPGPQGSHQFALAFRFVLDPAVVPGRYPLPVLVTAQPLGAQLP